MTNQSPLPFWKAAIEVLDEAGTPLHYEEITKRSLERGLVETQGKTPSASMNAQMAVKIKRMGDAAPFVRTEPGVFALTRWIEDGVLASSDVMDDDSDRMIRIPHYPRYSKLRLLLPCLAGLTKRDVTWMKGEIYALKGTPQDPADWQDPDTWIPERLDGRVRELALRVWEGTQRQVNPRYLTSSWLLATNFDLIAEDAEGILHVTPAGEDFIDDPSGDTVRSIDALEGIDVILQNVAEIGPARKNDLLPVFKKYALEVSNLRADSTINSFLWARLRNLLDRGLVSRDGQSYTVTETGLDWLAAFGVSSGTASTRQETVDLLQLVQRQAVETREQLQATIDSMDPFIFEHLVKALLEAMDYEDVEVTSKSGDGGVDVIGSIQLGITEVREVVQVKRHQKNIQRSTLDALRGSLHRFGAVRGTIITNGDFAKGTRDAAFEPGGAPITLINGTKLIDLMIEHKVGVKKRTLEILDLDLESLSHIGNDDEA
ncbi:restriction endonuclease [bacterium]|nr:restriction endonuclease [bacterium]